MPVGIVHLLQTRDVDEGENKSAGRPASPVDLACRSPPDRTSASSSLSAHRSQRGPTRAEPRHEHGGPRLVLLPPAPIGRRLQTILRCPCPQRSRTRASLLVPTQDLVDRCVGSERSVRSKSHLVPLIRRLIAQFGGTVPLFRGEFPRLGILVSQLRSQQPVGRCASPGQSRAVVHGLIASRGQVVVGSSLLLSADSLILFTRRLIAIGHRLIAIAQRLVTIGEDLVVDHRVIDRRDRLVYDSGSVAHRTHYVVRHGTPRFHRGSTENQECYQM